ncbi:GxxExxY protein [Foetidibacter luteolus]|uniref:GxxExxY protein n=1 Tax=Foetidibacter luteolus TaxID=2608880 RepID=UPI00129BF4F4|nr:GxxExxY protein [Foetidibacter luteolus]
MTKINLDYFPLKKETELIIRTGIEIHKTLGFGFLEIVYKDAFEYEFTLEGYPYEREKRFEVAYKGILLPHPFNADFVVFDSVILEVKSKEGIANEDLAQTINYLKCSGCKVGLILNFGRTKLDIKRMVL